MTPLLALPAAAQGLVIAADELFFHRHRELPAWEIIGHPLDTATVAAAYAFLHFASPTVANAWCFGGLALFSSLFVTKDEFVHAERCRPLEHWLHSLLFLLHPAAFAAAGLLWMRGEGATFIKIQLLLTSAFFLYQIIYWGIPWARNR